MCGIAGYATLVGAALEQSALSAHLERACRALKHRGPDDQGTWISLNRRVGFSHTRLAILDLSPKGHQPMIDGDNNAITFNGEIYNYRELKTRYSNHSFQSESDTEVLLEGLRQSHASILGDLDGMFAFAYYSESKNQLLLATDPAGKKPIYTYWDGKSFAFASEIKALFQFPNLNFALERDHLKISLIYGYVPYPNTVYRYIRKLPAGHFQIIPLDGKPMAPVCYWDVPLGQIDHQTSLKKAEETLKLLMADAVKKRLIADVSVASFLSGGLDSSAVTYEAAQALPPGTFQTFSAGFNKDAFRSIYDESEYARKVATMVGTKHYSLQIDAKDADATKIMNGFDEPFGDSSAIPTYLLCQETSRHVKVVLSGDGGDELFGGYLRFRASLLSERYKSLWQSALAPMGFLKGHPQNWIGRANRFRSVLNHPLLMRLTLWNSFFNEEELENFLGEAQERHLIDLKRWDEKTKNLPIGEKILYFNFKTYLFDDLLPKMDRMSMAHSLEVRSPFLDKKLIEFAFQLPTSYKFSPFRTKIILKNTYRKILGKEITDRPKHGFAFPIETLLKTTKPMVRDIKQWFPEVTEKTMQTNPLNYFSKKFMLFVLENSLSSWNLREQNAS